MNEETLQEFRNHVTTSRAYCYLLYSCAFARFPVLLVLSLSLCLSGALKYNSIDLNSIVILYIELCSLIVSNDSRRDGGR